MQNGPTETSVLVSLRELVALEDERLREEREARARADEAAAQARKETLERAQAAEQARRLAEEQARLARARQEAEEQAKLAAIAQAEVERARVEAQAAAARAARDTELAHQRALARHDNERQKTRLKLWGVGLLLAATVGAGGLGLMAMQPVQTTEDPRIARLEREQQELLKDRLTALDALHERLKERLGAYEGEAADFDAVHAPVVAARVALEGDGLSDEGLDAYDAALERLATEVGRAHRLARWSALREAHEGLAAQVDGVRRPTPALTKAAEEAEASRQGVDAAEPIAQDLEAYDAALKKLARAVAEQPKPAVSGGRGVASSSSGEDAAEGPVCQDYHDPLCARLTRD